MPPHHALATPPAELVPAELVPAELVLVDSGSDPRPRWRPGDRLDRLFEQQCDRLAANGGLGRAAVDDGQDLITYDQLDRRANQLARYLIQRGVRPGDRVALLFERGPDAYAAMLAVLKVHAAYVPLDPGFPTDRIGYILGDARARMILTTSNLRDRLPAPSGVEPVLVDETRWILQGLDNRRLHQAERGVPTDHLAYLIYTSGSTGRPKGVAVDHPSICNFVRVAAEVYGVRPDDRMYQGLTMAFDFSVEEVWVPWMVGATLVPKPAGGSLVGADLHEFLTRSRVTAMCCVPTLLATIADDLPGLRLLLVSGEACPQDLITRWWRPGRRFLNVYGPTEACVSATWTELHPDKPVTIGRPLPTYSCVVLDPENPMRALPRGETGELGIAGIGLARGYLNRDDLTAKAFIPDFLHLPFNPTRRIYRTGDLCRVNGDGEIEYHGRIDLQVKIRGYRIELTEIESVLMQVPGIAQAVVDTYQPSPDAIKELVGYYSVRPEGPAPDREALSRTLRDQLPPYMVPAYLEQLDVIPMTPQDKADRKNLPPPTRRRAATGSGRHVPAATGIQRTLAGVLGEVLGLPDVSIEAHFFDELPGNSLLMADFATRVRKIGTVRPFAMKDIYLNPTVAKLAHHLGDTGEGDSDTGATAAPARRRLLGHDLASQPTRFLRRIGESTQAWLKVHRLDGHSDDPAGDPAGGPPRAELTDPAPTPHRAGACAYWLTGLMQVLTGLGVAYLGAWLFRLTVTWIFAGAGTAVSGTAVSGTAGAGSWSWVGSWSWAEFGELYRRSALVGAGLFALAVLVPILAKWLLIGRWTPREIRLWSPGYLRFWLVRSLTMGSPVMLFAGSPLFVWYLRALGAKVGKGVTLHAGIKPVATDLLTIGDRAVIAKGVTVSGYRAVSGVLQVGSVTIGAGAHLAEKTVLDINVELGAGAELGHSSSLQAGQVVPAGATWHGSPAEPTKTGYRRCPELPGRPWRKPLYSLLQLVSLFGVAPLLPAALIALLPKIPAVTAVYSDGLAHLHGAGFYLVLAGIALALLVAGLVGGLLFITTVPRMLHALFIRPGKVYPLYGFRYLVHRSIGAMTNSQLYLDLFGDSSAIPYYLRLLGYKLDSIVQSGSNFGATLQHDTPYLCEIGTETMVSDGLTLMNADYSRTAFQVSPVAIGPNNYLGNFILYPSGGRTGANVLLGTKVAVPIDGPVRENCGLLGSPAFEIPRSVERDSRFDHLKRPAVLRIRLRRKNRHNFTTVLIYLTVTFLRLLLATVLAGATLALYRLIGELALVAAGVVGLLTSVTLGVLVERLSLLYRRLRPRYCSIYDPYFWRHERHWKLLMTSVPFAGTPFNPLILRLLGVRMGRRVFNDGCGMPEKTLVSIGDHATLNAGAIIQCHSLEDGTFKSDHTTVGAGATLGVAAFVHYGVTMGAGARLDADSFLMKGETVDSGDRWVGNPAQPKDDRAGVLLTGPQQWNAYDLRLMHRLRTLEDELARVRRLRSRTPVVLSTAAAVLVVINIGLWLEPSLAGPARPMVERLRALVPSATDARAAPTTPAVLVSPSLPVEEPAVTFIRNHYDKLPGDVGGAFSELSVTEQRRVGGSAGFAKRYRDVASVQLVEPPVMLDERTAAVVVRTQRKGGRVATERVEHVLSSTPGGVLKLDGTVGR